jgi:hypothetical protein
MISAADETRLLDECVKIHDYFAREQLSRNHYAEAPYVSAGDLASYELLTSLIATPPGQPKTSARRTLTGFILDNIVDAHVFTPVGTDDSSTEDTSVLTELRDRKNAVAERLGFGSYIDAYAATRGWTARRITGRAQAYLDETSDEYWALFGSYFTRGAPRENLDMLYRDMLLTHDPLFGLEPLPGRLRTMLEEVTDNTTASKIEMSISDDAPVTYACSILSDGRGYLVSAPCGGLEQYKAAFHGLGHALYTALPAAEPWVDLPVDLTQTEGMAFIFEAMPAVHARRYASLPELQARHLERLFRFISLYFGRLYAGRWFLEDVWYRKDLTVEMARALERKLVVAAVGFQPPADGPGFYIDWRPLCAEFLGAAEIAEMYASEDVATGDLRITRTAHGKLKAGRDVK